MSERKHSRWPLLGLVVVIVAVATVALTGAAKKVPGLEFIPSGHWIASPALGLVVRINGATRKPDAQVSVPGLEPGGHVVQDEAHGYVVGSDDVTIFGKSTLSVETTVASPVPGEQPVPIETSGGAYSVYRQSGQIVRLGVPPRVMSANGPLGPPVATPDGTVWVHLTGSGAICGVARGATDIACAGVAPTGHTGGLTVSGGRLLFVDTTDDTVRVVETKGFGPAVPLGVDVPPDARIAPADAAGRVAVLDPSSHRLHLVEARVDEKGALTGQRSPATSVSLEAGEYDGPSVSGESVVLLERRSNSVRTYDSQGRPRGSTPFPQEKGRPELVRGEDARVYVNGGEGRHVVVVDRDGSVQPVPVVPAKPEDRRQPAPPPPEKSADDTAPPGNPGRPVPPPPPPTQAPPPVRTPPPIPVTPPGMPQNLAIAPGQANATVTWGAAPANGAPVTAYLVSWQSDGGITGQATVSARSHVIAGIGTGPFTVTVAARNSAGTGTPASARYVPPRPTPKITLSQGARAPECGRSDCYWMRVVMTGFTPNTKYQVTPHSSVDYHNPGRGSTVDANGNAEFNAFYYHMADTTVWVEANGIESNRVTWTE
ncbi:fibronectin type III domain-containing protein [Lentzea sp. NPDC060358]|uniref:fibronectin type III domain-containing protein n=1 Tax=Lentzea sp. NPDC060358 TaxID=3347103 RepID=UPI003650A91B